MEQTGKFLASNQSHHLPAVKLQIDEFEIFNSFSLSVKWCQLQIGTCHSSSTRIKSCAATVLIFNISWKEFRVGANVRPSVLQEKLSGQIFRQLDINWQDWSSDRHFQEPIYEPNSCISSYLEKHWNLHCDYCSSWLAKAPRD